MWKQKLFNKSILALIILPIVLSGCIINVKNEGEVGLAGGFFISDDQGKTWVQRNSLYTSNGEAAGFSNSNISLMAFDPQDENAIYLATQTDGIFYTYNVGKGWMNSLGNQGTVNDIIVSPVDKCTVYAAVHNKIWRTDDCSRSWETIYFEARPDQFINTLNISYSDPNLVYAGTNGGSFLISRDRGATWEVLYRFEDDVRDIIIQNHSDSNIIYVITKSKGVFRSKDAGQNWEDLMRLEVFEIDDSQPKSDTFKAIKLKDESKPFFKISGVKLTVAADSDRSVPDSLIYTNRIGMFRLVGDHWEQIKLLTPEKKDTIYSVAINPLDGKEIYYGTDAALYHTVDGGVNWEISELPTTRAAGALRFSPSSKLLYLGAFKINQ